MEYLTTLIADVRLIGSILDSENLEDSIEFSSGIVPAKTQYESFPYWQGAFVPRLPWRKPAREELELLSGSVEELRPGRWVQVFSFPQSVYDAFASIRTASANVTSEQEMNVLRPTSECKEAVKVALQYASKLISPATQLGGGNVYFNLPGLPTTSNYKDPVLLGIHTDTLCEVELKYRPFSPNRLCLNLGLCDRYLLFVNLGLNRIESLLRQHNIQYQEAPGKPPLQAFRMAFMSSFQAYPVVKLRIRPGEGYIAPTENLLHDGSSEGQTAFDVPFHAHGHFRPVLD
jgi:hypothetical protein